MGEHKHKSSHEYRHLKSDGTSPATILYAEDLNELAEKGRYEVPGAPTTTFSWRDQILEARFKDDRIELSIPGHVLQAFVPAEKDSESGIGLEGLRKLKCSDCDGLFHGEPITAGCGHVAGIAYTVDPELPSHVVFHCKECRRACLVLVLAERPKAEYPYLYCSHHGIELSYVVCDHVMDGSEEPCEIWAAVEDNAGAALCGACLAGFSEDSTPAQKKKARRFSHMICESSANQILKGALDNVIAERSKAVVESVN